MLSKPVRQGVGLLISGRMMWVSSVRGFMRSCVRSGGIAAGCKAGNVYPINAVMFGAPGSGKGTISGRLVQDFHLHHISSGDVLRKHIREQTAYGKEIEPIVKSGGLVPTNMLASVMEFEMKNENAKKNGYLFDGYPRTVEQAQLLDKSSSPNVVIYLNVPFETIIDRIKSRWIHASSGRIYNLEFSPPKVEGKDDVTGEPLIQREDDKPESVLRRLELFQKEADPLLRHYRARGILQEFEGTESNKIYPRVIEFLLKHFSRN